MKQLAAGAIIWAGTAVSALAQTAADIDRLAAAMNLPEVIEIMRLEGLQTGRDMAAEMFPSGGSPRWERMVSDIYDEERMMATVREGFDAALQGVDLAPLITFFEGDLGRRIIALEISGRRALLDDAVEQASREMAAELLAEDAGRLALLDEFIEVNDLLELNVIGAMNSNLAFYRGMGEGGGLDAELTEEDILRQVWSQEEEIRADTHEWLYGYLTMAYRPIGDEELRSYVELSRSAEGQALNRALFAGFDPMFEGISRALGRATAEIMRGEDL